MIKNSYNVKDAELIKKIALPDCSGGAASSESALIDLKCTENKFIPGELEVVAPALTDTQLPTGGTMSYSILHSDDDSSYSVLYKDVIVQTGAGDGAEEASVRVAIPTTAKEYLKLKPEGNATADDCSGAEAEFSLVL